jgi:hypothetical protein
MTRHGMDRRSLGDGHQDQPEEGQDQVCRKAGGSQGRQSRQLGE